MVAVHWMTKKFTGLPVPRLIHKHWANRKTNPLGNKKDKPDKWACRGSQEAAAGGRSGTCNIRIGRAAGKWSTQKRPFGHMSDQMSPHAHTSERAYDKSKKQK